MKTISVTELEARLSEQLHQVEAGAEIVVTDRGRPIARLVPIAGGAEADIERLVAAGLARPGELLDAEFWSLPRAEPPEGLVAALLEEREEGR